jgi:hypothetical protein
MSDEEIIFNDNLDDGEGLCGVYSGGAAHALAESFAQQFKDDGGENYLELSFEHPDIDGALMVTLQRVEGETPCTKLADAKAEIERLNQSLARVGVISLPAHELRGYIMGGYGGNYEVASDGCS